jgi:hypothetical protein
MITTLEQFINDWRDKESQPLDARLRMTCACGKHMLENHKLSDEELREMYNILIQEESATGVENHGETIGGKHVLTLKDTGDYNT